MGTPENKTRKTGVDPMAFFATVENDARRADAIRLMEIMRQETGEEPYMYGSSIVGFGTYHYRYESGHEGDAPAVSFSPRKPHLVVYLIGGYEDRYQGELARLGPYKTGKSCLYIKRLGEVDENVLRWMIRDSYNAIKNTSSE